MPTEFMATYLQVSIFGIIPRVIGAAIFLIALYFVIKKAVKDAMDESGRPKS